MPGPVVEAETFIQVRLTMMASRNEHHLFEEIATRIAQRRVATNILVATGPVSAGGDQGRDAESFTTYLPEELPHAAGFVGGASTRPVVVACTVQQTNLKQKVLSDLASICRADAAPVDHIAYFSVHPIPAGTTHELQKTARDTYNVDILDVFCGADIAVMLAEPDLVWVAEHYLQLPAHLIPDTHEDAAPEWYTRLLAELRRTHGPTAITLGVQADVVRGLRHATWESTVNADLPEWLSFMGSFLVTEPGSHDTDLVFRACYEMAVARFRGQGIAGNTEDLIRRATTYALASSEPKIVDDAFTLLNYWGLMWMTGVARAQAGEVGDAVDRLRQHCVDLLLSTNSTTHPVRAATLTGALALAGLTPDWRRIEQARGAPPQAAAATDHVGVRFEPADVDTSSLKGSDLTDLDGALRYLNALVELLPRARPYSVRQLATIFTMFAPLTVDYPSYVKIRNGLDAATADAAGDAAAAERCRDRAITLVRSGKNLEALGDLHDAKLKWYGGDTLYGSILTMRFIAQIYADLGLTYAAKMYACAATTLALSTRDDDIRIQAPKALLEAAEYARQTGTWIDAAGLTELAVLARAELLTDPFDFDKHPDLARHHTNSALTLAAVRSFWPDIEPLLQAAQPRSGWYDLLAADVGSTRVSVSEERLQAEASRTLAGPLLGDVGPTRQADFQALGVRWIFEYANDHSSVLAAECLVATLQIVLADLAVHHPVLIQATEHVDVRITDETGRDAYKVNIDDSQPRIDASVTVPKVAGNAADQGVALIATCLQLIHAVHVRPTADLHAVVEPMMEQGLPHKIWVGRPYQETADLLDEEHYERCASATRPSSSANFRPALRQPLAASTHPGPGYDQAEALDLIKERYRLAGDTLRFTLPRIVGDENERQTIVHLRNEGWLDWQILAVFANVAMDWRLRRDGLDPRRVTPTVAHRLLTEAETPASPLIPLDWFRGPLLGLHIVTQPIVAAQRWQLRPRPEDPDEPVMLELLRRRYRFADDDVPHTDLLQCVTSDGRLEPLLPD